MIIKSLHILAFFMMASALSAQTYQFVLYGDTAYMEKYIWLQEKNHIVIDSGSYYRLKDSLPSFRYKVYYDRDTNQIAEEGTYINHRKVGNWKYYDRTGSLVSDDYYGHDSGNHISFKYRNDSLFSIISMNSKNMLDGTVMLYYRNGNIKEMSNYRDGQLCGLQQYFYKNGEVESKGFMVENIQVGLWKYWNQEGKLVKTERHSNNLYRHKE